MRVGEQVKVLAPVDGKNAVQFAIGRIIYLGRRVLIEFEQNICGHNGNGLGKSRHCWMVGWDVVKQIGA